MSQNNAGISRVKNIHITDANGTKAEVTSQEALTVAPPKSGQTAFGEALVGSLSPLVALDFPYGISPILCETRANQSGSAAGTNSMAVLSTGAAANSSCGLLSKQVARYEPGLGLRSRFTALFTTGVANSTQTAGIGDLGEGFFFGYNGTSFGVLHRYGGAPEIRTLTVSTASTTAEDITITLNGDATATVTVTNSGNTTTTANEIAAHDYSDVGPGWTATAVGSTVVFTSWEDSSQTGTYSLSSATTAVGTFAQTLAGATPTENWTAQASWNGVDIFDGNGITGTTLDPTKGNVFQIDFQYLGFGNIHFYIENPGDGEYHLVHTIEYSNANTVPSLDNPSMPLFWEVKNTSNTSDLSLSAGSGAIFIDGLRINAGLKRGIKANLSLGATSAETPITSFRVKEVFNSKQNRSKIKINYIAAAVEHSKPCAINFYANATLTDASFTDIAAATSSVQQDTSATAFSGGVFLFGLYLGKTGNQLIDLKDDLTAAEFSAGNTVTATLAPTSGNSAEGDVSINFTEKL